MNENRDAKETEKSLRIVELRLISELMKSSCRSDRELAKAMGVSQPTVSRIKAKLQKEGVISEFTIIPDFRKLGYHLFALTFFSWKRGLTAEQMEEARTSALERSSSVPSNVVLIERGIGLNYDSFMASFHRSYGSYTELVKHLKTSPYIDFSRMDSFLVNLDDTIHYRHLTFSTLAKHLLETEKRE